MTVFNAISHASSRKATGLAEADYDHEIWLIDHTTTNTSTRSRSQSVGAQSRQDSLGQLLTQEDLRRHSSESYVRKKNSLRDGVERKRYSKYLDPREGQLAGLTINEDEGDDNITISRTSSQFRRTSRPRTRDTGRSSKATPPESAIDILYENQRGIILCGQRLFSSKALGAFDAPPWTNIALKPSATNITNATVPDPSWDWAWKDWVINHEDEVDEDGWEYSFAYSNCFSWHGPTWWNSFVRRRAWIRKRVRSRSGYTSNDPHLMNPDYFTIHSHQERSRSESRADSNRDSRYSVVRRHEVEELIEKEVIHDISTLLKALRFSRIDREKTEAVENFVEHAEDDLFYLSEHMHDIMSQFTFQASRRSLLAHLSWLLDAEEKRTQEELEDGKHTEISKEKTRLVNLQKTVKAADTEVKRLEYWSDIKEMAEGGETKGAADKRQGWGSEWVGLDNSAPKDVLTERNIPGTDDDGTKRNGNRNKPASMTHDKVDKGKGKA